MCNSPPADKHNLSVFNSICSPTHRLILSFCLSFYKPFLMVVCFLIILKCFIFFSGKFSLNCTVVFKVIHQQWYVSITMHWIDSKYSLHSLWFNLLCSINYSGISFHPILFFFFFLLCMRFCRNIIDCYTHGNRSCFTHKCRASSVFPLLTISIFSLCSFPIQGFFLCHLLLFTFRSSLAGPHWISCLWALLAQCQ